MKFTLNVNQKQALELGLTSINQALIFDLLTSASTWASATQHEGEIFYWVARQVVVDELPILDLKADTVYRHLKSLAEIGLIDYKKQGRKDLIRITAKGKQYMFNSNSEIDPSKLGNESELQAQNSEIDPTYQSTNNQITTLSDKTAKAVDDVFEYWQAIFGKQDYKLTAGRRNKIKARLKSGCTERDLMKAIKGCSMSPFHMGQNDNGTVYNDLTLICRSDENVDRFKMYMDAAPVVQQPQQSKAQQREDIANEVFNPSAW